MKTQQQGRILKGVGGVYTVLLDGGETALCPAKGLFRHTGDTPLTGDRVVVAAEGEAAYIDEILPRTTCLSRPPLANLDRLWLVVSTVSPVPNALVLDRLIALAECKGIEPVLIFTKNDLAGSPLAAVYRLAGFPVWEASLAPTPRLVDGGSLREALLPLLAGHVTGLTGNSGVGKSTLLSALFPELVFATGEISEKLGRGRHTTRVCQLFPAAGGFVADTPGFSSWDTETGELMTREALPRGFREFGPYIGQCRFPDCSHTSERGCAVLAALADGKIDPSRHKSYLALYAEVKDLRDWQLEHRSGVVR